MRTNGLFRHRQLAAAICLSVMGVALAPHAIAQDTTPQTLATQNTDNSAAKKVVQLNSVSVNATYQQSVPPTAAYTQSVITEDTIRNLSPGPTVTVQTLLQQQPSVFVYSNGPGGVETSVYLRAFDSSQFSETYDGVALNDLFNGGVTGQAENRNNVLLIPANIQSVDIYRGINNPAVNSYNSLGGTINYVPREPADTMGGDVGASYGSFNSWDYHATFNTGNWNGVKQVFSFTHSASDGWIDNTGDHNNNLYWGLTYAIDDSNTLTNYLLYNNNKGFSPYPMPVPLLQQYGRNYQWPLDWNAAPIKDTNWMDIVDFKSKFSDDIAFDNKLFFGHNDYVRTSYSNPLDQQSDTQPYALQDSPTGYAYWLGYPSGPTYDPTATFGSADAGTDYHFYGYATTGIGDSPSITFNLPNNEVVVGGNFTYGYLHSREYWYGSAPVPQVDGYNDAWDEHDHRNVAAFYVQDTLSLFDDALKITPGVKYIHAVTTDHDDVGFYYPISGSVHDNEHFMSPTLGLNYEVEKGLNVYASYGKNFKLPDISAYYGAFQTDANGNNTIAPPKTKPEYVQDFEVGARYSVDGFSATLNAYRENFENTFITQTNPVTFLSTVTNGGSSRYQGQELQLLQDFGQTELGDINAYFNYAHNQATFTSSFSLPQDNVISYTGQVNAGQPVAGVPSKLISAGLVWKLADWRVNLDGRFIGKQYLDQQFAGTPTSATIGGHTVVDIGVSDTLHLAESGFGKSVKLSLNVDNLLDKQYLNTASTTQDYYGNNYIAGIIAPPRMIMGSVDIDF